MVFNDNLVNKPDTFVKISKEFVDEKLLLSLFYNVDSLEEEFNLRLEQGETSSEDNKRLCEEFKKEYYLNLREFLKKEYFPKDFKGRELKSMYSCSF